MAFACKFYNFSSGEERKIIGHLNIIEQSVNEAVATRDHTKIKETLSRYTYLIFLYINKYGPVARLNIQMADCMALIAQFTKRLDSEPMLNCALNLYNEILTIPEHSDDHCTIVARRCISYLSLMGVFHSIIDIQQKLVDRSPQNVAELSKLGEMRYAVRNNLNPQDMFEKLLELDQYIGENLVSDQMF